MKEFFVKVPFAAVIEVFVDAESEEEAKRKAIDQVGQLAFSNESWERAKAEACEGGPLERFHMGNVCYCPSPWEIEAEEE